MSSSSPKQTPLAQKRRWFRIENKTQLDLFEDREAQAAEALKELEELKRGPKENRPEGEEPRSGITTKGITALSMPHPATEGKRGQPC